MGAPPPGDISQSLGKFYVGSFNVAYMKSNHLTTRRVGSHFCKNPGATIHHLQLLQLLRIYCTWYREDLSLTALRDLRHKADKL